ncbi:symplekin [Cryptococcus deuterogattii LA55]|nr:symplekin [Cryptococcus deuterogattii LA55]KIR35188.1 symplekin [Cryptococcus deuterogattii MMRL2647]KIR93676.1 symplekin [Cryptococcus deuterogattii CBS 10090]
MSLYADDDPTKALQLTDEQPTLQPPTDPQQALNAALALDSESPEQQEGLQNAAQRFEEHPERLPEVIPRLLGLITEGGDSLLRFWTLDMIALTVGRSGLMLDVKLHVAQYCLTALNKLLHSDSVPTIKAVIPILSTIYPILFRLLATSRPSQQVLDLFNVAKSKIISFALDPNARPFNVGIKAVAWKFVQRVLLAATRAAGSDPRLPQRGAGSNDVNVSHIVPNGCLSASDIEKEGTLLQTQLVTHLYSSSEPAILHPLINTLPAIAKMRPTLAPLVVHSLASWTPSALVAAGRSAMEIRAVDKTVRIAISHLLRHPPLSAHAAQLNDALVRQKARMEAAFIGEALARKERRQNLKHTIDPETAFEAESSEQAAKRARLDGLVGVGSGMGKGPEIDVSGMRLEEVVEVVLSSLRSVSLELLTGTIENAKRALQENSTDAQPLLAAALGVSSIVKEEEEEEILNPLDMEDDDDDLLMDGPEPLMEEEEPTSFTDFVLPAPEPLEPSDKEFIFSDTIERIWQTGADLASLPDPKDSDATKLAVKPKEMWMLLLARLATRGADVKRKVICDFIIADFANRSKFASVWLNEEWYNEKIGVSSPGQYLSNLEAIVTAYLPKVDSKDKSLSTFILTLPAIPPSLISTLETICQEPERALVGFLALRDIVEVRPPVRPQALQTLLELCTHPDRKIRVMAIITTVRRWGNDSPMMPFLTKYALGVLWRLANDDVKSEDVDMEEGEQADEKIQSKFLGEPNVDNVQQHVELAFALAKRKQDLLDDIFRLYPRLEPAVQDVVEAQLMPLIQSLGATEKLLEILRKFPNGADKLVMRVVGVLSAEGSKTLVTLMKTLLSERDLDPRFVIPIVGDLDKAEIEKQLPRIVSLLGDVNSKDMVKTAFASMLQKMTPSDLMVALHQEGAPLKLTIEAIGICFSMTTVFRSDVLANAMSRIADLSTIPLIFVRTIIQVVTTYKSLAPFIANHILPKLVTKKIWEIPQLWDGFIMLAKRIAPASFGALLQLPKEQLKEVVEKQPGLKSGLKGFLANKPGSKAAMAEIFGDD